MGRELVSERQWLYTRRQAAELFGISVSQLKCLEQRGVLKPVKLGGDSTLTFYRRQDLMDLAGLSEGSAA